MATVIYDNAFQAVIFLVLCSNSLGEPRCSKFHYEEQTLHKLVRLEFEMEQMVKETRSILEEMRTEMSAIRKERDELRDTVDTWKLELKEKMGNMSEWSQRLTDSTDAFKTRLTTEVKELSEIPTIWFLAKDPVDSSPATNQVIIYGTVVENVGSGYDSTTGKFTAPVPGLYAFTIHACAHSSRGWHYAFMKDETLLLSGRDYEPNAGYPCTSATVYAVLKTGDTVFIKWWSGSTGIQIHTTDGRFWNSFAGVLIHE